MNIYFVNKKSNIKGPFDITDTHHQKIIKIGDVIIRDYDNCILFLLVVCNTNKWNTCHCVCTTEGNLEIDGNTLLFSFDGISQRYGNIHAITKLLEKFSTPPINDFFRNILSILEYKCDYIDATIFYQIHTITPIKISETNKKFKNEKKDFNSATYLFEAYLNQDLLIQFQSLLKQNTSLREIYIEIKRQHPDEFRKAIKAFHFDFPDSTIYDKVND